MLLSSTVVYSDDVMFDGDVFLSESVSEVMYDCD
jgi:hypothetical protein